MSDFDDFVRQSEHKKRLRGADIVKKNEEYIAKHREAEYQRQKADTERRLQDALAQHAQPQHQLDETSRLGRHKDLADPNSVEPGLEYKPMMRGRVRVPEHRLRDIHIINRCIVT
jgi:hypothetical protein